MRFPIYALPEVTKKIEAVGDRVAHEEREEFGDEVPTRAERNGNVVQGGVEVFEGISVDFVHLQNAETHDALMVGFPDHDILITQDPVYKRVHARVGEKAFDTGQGSPEQGGTRPRQNPARTWYAGGTELYTQMERYLETARVDYAQAKDGDDMKTKMIQAFPD